MIYAALDTDVETRSPNLRAVFVASVGTSRLTVKRLTVKSADSTAS